MKRPPVKELRIVMPHDDLWLLRMKAAQCGMSVPQYMRKILHEEKQAEVPVEKKHKYPLF